MEMIGFNQKNTGVNDFLHIRRVNYVIDASATKTLHEGHENGQFNDG